MNFLLSIAFVLGVFAAVVFLFHLSVAGKPKKKPTTKLENVIKKRSEAIQTAEVALNTLKQDVYSKILIVGQLEKDIQKLQDETNKALKANDEKLASNLMREIMEKEKEIELRLKDYQEAVATQLDYESLIDQHRKKLEDLKNDVKKSKITLDMAKAHESLQKSDATTAATRSETTRQAIAADAKARSQVTKKDEFLLAAEEAEIKKRLAGLKK